ncbi:dihydrolipoyl dehydrogenase [Mumia sp.]|uniref:dihydrolipoyl dehydrogenase n=1 Tax=Mumia sp. TaxID=1965300 RepID=UPI002616E5C9|nr:dihydrolipoyl dehydrogenase [Mumia sp.]MDD9348785.1 dihydrolipoyl dehydrogenase [Mumia sp.]
MTRSAPPDHDVVVLGGGSGGYATALRARQLGLSVALVEEAKLGGTCLHLGCIPTKAMLHAAEVADAARDASAFGVRATYDGVDLAAVGAYRAGVVERLYRGLQGLVRGAGIDVVEGTGRLVGPRSVAVGDTVVTGRTLVLATGSYARTLPGVEITGRVVTSDGALALEELPRRVVVVGGSAIGVELASVWRSFGSEVTVVEALPHLVPLEDETLSVHLERAFRKRGIAFRTGTPITGVKQDDTTAYVTLDGGETLEADLVLVAVGRGPRTDGLGLAEHGITVDRGFVVTDERLRTSVDGVYAVGDVVRGLQLAHRGFAHGIFVAEDVAGRGPRPVVDSGIPRVTYCDPEIASVGLTEAQARAAHGDDRVTTYEYNLAGNGKTQILRSSGLVKVVREVDGPVLGVHMIGARMGEQVGEASLWVNWDAFPEDVAAFVHAHPTQNEALGEAALALAGSPLHAHA